MKRVFNLAFILFACVLFIGSFTSMIDNAYGQGRGDKRPAYMVVRDSTVTRVLIDPDFLDEIVLKSGSGNAPLADSAITLRLQKLTTGHFVATSLDSLIKLAIDSADFARFVRAGAITTSSAFSPTFLDSLQGDEDNYLILYARNARSADSAGYSDYADEAGTANYAIKYIGTDTIPAARFSNISDYAAVAGSALSQQGYFTASQWDSIYDSTLVWFDADSAAFADTAGEVKNSAIDRLSAFNSTVQDSYLVTKAYRQALNGAPASLTSTNPVMDTTTASKRLVRNPADAIQHIGIRGSTVQIGSTATLIADTSTADSGAIVLYEPSGTRWVFPDSNLVAKRLSRAINEISDDYVLRGLGGIPNRITTSTSTPSGGTDGDLWVVASGSDTAFYVRYSGSWRELVGGGGGGGSPTSVSTNSWGTVDADSLVPNLASVAETAINGYFVYTNGFMLNNNRSADFLGRIKADSIVSYANSIFYLGASGDTIKTPSNGWIGKPNDVANSAAVAARYMTVQGPCTVRTALFAEDIYVDPHAGAAQEDIGTRAQTFDDIYGEEIQAIGTATANASIRMVQNSDSFYVDHEHMVLRGVNIIQANSNTTISDGSITITGGGVTTPSLDIGGGSTWGSSYLQVGGGDSINIPASASLRIQNTGTAMLRSGAELLVPSDTSNSFADIATGSEQYFLLLDDEKQGLRGACPDPSSTNHVTTMARLKQVLDELLTPIDTVATRRATPRRYTYSPGCNDTIKWGSANQAVFWPRMRPLPSPAGWGDNMQLIEPWQWPTVPGIPSPINVDSTSGAMSYFDPHVGIAEHNFKVSSRFDSRFGYLTGHYQTIKQACDSLPSFRVRLDSCIASLSSGNKVAVRITPRSSFGGNQIRAYRGETLIADSIRAGLPDHITQIGTYVKFRRSGDEEGRWCQTTRWDSDTLFYVQDSVIFNYFNSFAGPDSAWDLAFAVKTTIQVLPPVDGGMIVLDTTVTINDECPVRIEGAGKTEVIITNTDGTTTPDFSTMFATKLQAAYDTCYTGMPIEFANMTIFFDSVASSAEPVIYVSGDVLFQDMNIIARSSQGVTNKGVIQHEYFDTQYVRGDTPGIIMENVTCALDSDAVLVGLLSDSTTFQSYNSVYSVGGDSGRVLLYHANVWPNAGTQSPAQFFGDQFYFSGATVGKLAGTWTSQSWDSISVVQSHFVGLDGVTSDGSGALAGDWNNIIPGGNNSYSSVMTQPPGKLKELPVEVPYLPKK